MLLSVHSWLNCCVTAPRLQSLSVLLQSDFGGPVDEALSEACFDRATDHHELEVDVNE